MPNRLLLLVVLADWVVDGVITVVWCEWRYNGHSVNVVNAMADRMAGLQLIRGDASCVFLSDCDIAAGCNSNGLGGRA